jgi:hypothetical protein
MRTWSHDVRCPSPAAYAAYRADAELAALAPVRAACISATDVLVGDDVVAK